MTRAAFVLTISDRVSRGETPDLSGPGIGQHLTVRGYQVDLAIVSDDAERIRDAVVNACQEHDIVVTTGGTGLSPRDVTPEALRPVLDYEIPGFGEAMRADGREKTPNAILSRSFAGVRGRTLVIALPGSLDGALESFTAIEPTLEHALDTIAGHTSHRDLRQVVPET